MTRTTTLPQLGIMLSIMLIGILMLGLTILVATVMGAKWQQRCLKRLRWHRSDSEPQVDMTQWVSVVDEASGATYFWNAESGETRWDDPRGALAEAVPRQNSLQRIGSRFKQSNIGSRFNKHLNRKGLHLPITRHPKHGSSRDSCWEPILDEESGETYYVNKKTGETTWDSHAANDCKQESSRDSCWEPIVDEESGETYYVNKKTGETTWHRPNEINCNHDATTIMQPPKSLSRVSTLLVFCLVGLSFRLVGSTSQEDCIAGQKWDKNACTACSPGTYQNLQGQSSCEECGAGKYGDERSQTAESSCKGCENGYYCTGVDARAACGSGKYGNQPSQIAEGSCKNCEIGYYCVGASARAPCGAGKYGDESSLFFEEQCKTCVGSEMTSDPGSTSSSDCRKYYDSKEKCTAGRYWNWDVPTREQLDCLECNKGKYQDKPKKDYCKPCILGKYGDQAAQTESSQCKNCEKGYFCTGEASRSACAAGKYGDQTSLIFSWQCKTCTRGYFCTGASGSRAACAAGKYGDQTSRTSSSQCKSCENGYYCTGGASRSACVAGKYGDQSSSSQCKTCQKGYYCSGGASRAACAAGKYGDQTSRTYSWQCKVCSKGYFCTGSTGSRTPCGPGKYGDQLLNTLESQCKECDKGYFCTGLNGLETACAAGRYGNVMSLNASWQCKPCSAGKFGDQTAQTAASSCKSCGAGKYGDQTAQTAESSCKSCENGYYCTGVDARVACGSGKYGTQASQSAEESCKSCENGYYCTGLTGSRVACAAGTYGDRASQSAEESCKSCENGYYCTGGDARVSCEAGKYGDQASQNAEGSCKLCENGYSCAGGAACRPGKYVQRSPQNLTSTCKACPAGKSNDPSHPLGKCITCPLGMTSTEGAPGCVCSRDIAVFTKAKDCPGEAFSAEAKECPYGELGNKDVCPVRCGEGAWCPGGFAKLPMPGYWNDNNRDRVLPCQYPAVERCLGYNFTTENSTCGVGYQGKICQSCISGHYRGNDLVCHLCPASRTFRNSIGLVVVVSQSCGILLAVFITIAVMTAVVQLFFAGEISRQGVLKPSIGFVIWFFLSMQLLAQVTRPAVGVPVFLQSFYVYIDIFKIDFGGIMPPECITSDPFALSKLRFSVVLFLLFGICLLRMLEYRAGIERTLHLLLYLSYSSTTAKVLQMVHCIHTAVDSSSRMVLAYDTNYECFRGYHLSAGILAVFVLCCYCCLYPVGMLFVLIHRVVKTARKTHGANARFADFATAPHSPAFQGFIRLPPFAALSHGDGIKLEFVWLCYLKMIFFLLFALVTEVAAPQTSIAISIIMSLLLFTIYKYFKPYTHVNLWKGPIKLFCIYLTTLAAILRYVAAAHAGSTKIGGAESATLILSWIIITLSSLLVPYMLFCYIKSLIILGKEKRMSSKHHARPHVAEQTKDREVEMTTWTAVVDASSGSTYYWNLTTGEVRWDDPKAMSAEQVRNAPDISNNGGPFDHPSRNPIYAMGRSLAHFRERLSRGISSVTGRGTSTGTNNKVQNANPMFQRQGEGGREQENKLAVSTLQNNNNPWAQYLHEESGQYYFHNKDTGETTWVKP